MKNEKAKPNYFLSILSMHCPRCRKGPMFKNNNPYKKLTLSNIFDMHRNCPVCHQRFELEQGFWYGTGYVSYALAVGISIATFIAWLLFIGVSADDNRVFYWLGFNCFLLVVIQPWLMRISRAIYLYFFVKYDRDYEKNAPIEFDHKQ
jgi:hypothetical protein